MSSVRIRGASQHNLKNVSLTFPRDALVVFTGISGSGKSSLAFDTIYREGERRFLESLPSYARQFLGPLEKADVESVEGLAPSVAIDQKTVGRSPRSTVGTITEILDYLRLLYARLGVPHCTGCGKLVVAQSVDQICDRILFAYANRRVLLCSPLVRERKGAHRKILEDVLRDGFRRLRVDGKILRLRDGQIPELARSEKHTIDIVFDRLEVKGATRQRLGEAIEKCIELSQGLVRAVADTEEDSQEDLFSSQFACPGCGVDLPELEPRIFSFNSPYGACSRCEGTGVAEQLDPELLVAEPSRPLRRGGLTIVRANGKLLGGSENTKLFEAYTKRYGFTADSSWGDLSSEVREAFLQGDDELEGFLPALNRQLENEGAAWLQGLVREGPCPGCAGTRLSDMARAVRFRERGIHELCATPLEELAAWIEQVELDGSEALIGEPILRDVRSRLSYLLKVGLGYLTLERRASTLAGGEAQRLRLASQVGGTLRGVLYVLDEPSIGLHARDNARLLETLEALRDRGNTVVVVEHDLATMEAADQVIDVGPGAGPQGGEIVAQGSLDSLRNAPGSVTGDYLCGRQAIAIPEKRRQPSEAALVLHGVSHNNLRDVDVAFPLGLFIVVTGVSGSGKSSLVNQVLHPALSRKLGSRSARAGSHRALTGYTKIDKLVNIDQSPIGRSPRSNPATYVKLFDVIRELFAQTPEARARGYRPARFSFNRDGGRCLECGGAGSIVVDMQFLAPVTVLCDACGGKRYNRETLEVRYRGKSIYEVLEMTVSEGLAFLQDHPKAQRTLAWLEEVGLGYMRLGQPSTTLSGGEAQRVKLASELRRMESGQTLYLLDEPTTGLHFQDIRKLLGALQELVSRGNTVVVIEHNTDVMKVADHIIDLGPEAGSGGGHVIAQGTPEEVSQVTQSHTAAALRPVLEAEKLHGQPMAVESDPGTESDRKSPASKAPATPGKPVQAEDIVVRGARLHNLRGVDVRIPYNKLTTVTGVSGSGKTSLALDTLFAEGQRRYIESLSTYARRFLGRTQGAPVDSLTGLSPAIAIDQKSVTANPRSTVATMTEIHDYLRLLYARVGEPHCPHCDAPLEATTPSRLAARLVSDSDGEKAYILAPATAELIPRGGDGSALMQKLERFRSTLLRRGLTRVFVKAKEVRLDEEGTDPVYRMLEMLRADSSGSDTATEPSLEETEVVVDRVVLRESSQTRIADSLQQAFELGAGKLRVKRLEGETRAYFRLPTCPDGHFQFGDELSPRMFSFSSHQGACERCHGLGVEKRAALEQFLPEPAKPLLEALAPKFRRLLETRRPSHFKLLNTLCARRGIDIATLPFEEFNPTDRDAVISGLEEPLVLRLVSGPEVEATWPGLGPLLENWSLNEAAGAQRAELEPFLRAQTCSVCHGGRLRPELLRVLLRGESTNEGTSSLNIQEFTQQTVSQALAYVRRLVLPERLAPIAREVRREIENRLFFLENIGLGYLTLDRKAGTLSGGEAQRIRLASQLGNRLAGVLFVLDEPTIGLHPKDTQKLIRSLEELRDLGNTVVVVEHDREVMAASDWIVDMGPGPGRQGGEVVSCGTPAEVTADRPSLTAAYLRREKDVASGFRRQSPAIVPGQGKWLQLKGITHHNLRDVDVGFPLGAFTVVTGVSGSGKSSLVVDVLGSALTEHFGGRPDIDVRPGSLSGQEDLRRSVAVDQRPIGRSPRSNPATYTGLWTVVRSVFASLPESRVRGWDPSRFSFNVGDGRCSACDGQGAQEVEMHFLSDVWVPCDQCRGRRFNEDTLSVRFKGKNISDVLELEVDEACEFFENQKRMVATLQVLQAVGLGYVRLGQAANTLSGGEAQRVKLARELDTPSEGDTLYILDEPTTGLHFEDVRKLLEILRALVEKGNTVIAIEHHLDVMRAADWVVDLGPGAGDDGGRVVAAGRAESIAECHESHTGRCLKAELTATTPAVNP